MWHKAKREARAAKRAADEEERRKKGILNGREIFMQVGQRRSSIPATSVTSTDRL